MKLPERIMRFCVPDGRVFHVGYRSSDKITDLISKKLSEVHLDFENPRFVIEDSQIIRKGTTFNQIRYEDMTIIKVVNNDEDYQLQYQDTFAKLKENPSNITVEVAGLTDSPAPPEPVVAPPKYRFASELQRMVEMGFDEQLSRRCLDQTNGNIERAVEIIYN